VMDPWAAVGNELGHGQATGSEEVDELGLPTVWTGSAPAEEPGAEVPVPEGSGAIWPRPVAASETHCQASELTARPGKEPDADVAEAPDAEAPSGEPAPAALVALRC